MKHKAIEQYWNSDDCYLVFFGDVKTEENLKVAREAEYHLEDDEVVVVDVFWDDNDDMTECHEIDEKTLDYITLPGLQTEAAPDITREEYDELAAYVKSEALKSLGK